MSQFPKADSPWNKVFHERLIENSEESKKEIRIIGSVLLCHSFSRTLTFSK